MGVVICDWLQSDWQCILFILQEISIHGDELEKKIWLVWGYQSASDYSKETVNGLEIVIK